MLHEMYVYWVMFWAMPDWILAMVLLLLLILIVMGLKKLSE